MFAVARLARAATPNRRSDADAQVLVRRVDGVVAGIARTRAASAAALAPLVTPGGLEGQGRGRVWPWPQGLDERGDSRGVFGQLEGAWERQGWRLQRQRQVLWRRDTEAQPFLQSGLEAALGAARGQGRVTVGRILSTGQWDRQEGFIKGYCNFLLLTILQFNRRFWSFANQPTSGNSLCTLPTKDVIFQLPWVQYDRLPLCYCAQDKSLAELISVSVYTFVLVVTILLACT